MDIPPISVTSGSIKKKKRGPKKRVSWKDDFHDEFFKRLSTGKGRDTLEEECEELARWFAKKKIRPRGEKIPISASRLRELYREREGDAEKYKKLRKAYIDRLVDAALAFVAACPGLELPALPDP